MSEQTPDLDPEEEGEAGLTTGLTAEEVEHLSDQVAAEHGEPEATDVEADLSDLDEEDFLVEPEEGGS